VRPEYCRQWRRHVGCGDGDGFLSGLEAASVRLSYQTPISFINALSWASESVLVACDGDGFVPGLGAASVLLSR
jgi:hypothetical protein